MLNLVLFGPPGAGKGTQSNFLIEKYNLVHLSTGDILRGEIAAGTALGMDLENHSDRSRPSCWRYRRHEAANSICSIFLESIPKYRLQH